MKLKSYIIMLAAAAGTGLFSACEDMLEPTSEYVLYDDGSHLTTPADTANSLVGLFYKLQAIGDRTNLLGRRVKRSVYDEHGAPIATAGERVTPEMIAAARRKNRLLALTVNTLTNLY